MTGTQESVRLETLSGGEIAGVLDDLAALRISVFRSFPYLYEGDPAYEARYLEIYAASPGAVVGIAVTPEGPIVGATTAAPLGDHQPQLAEAFGRHGEDPADIFYLGESVLDPAYRGRGIGHRFFDLRESAGRMQGFSTAAFCAVVRPADHPLRPDDYRPLDPFWQARGYEPVAGLRAPMRWRDIGEESETEKLMQFWLRRID
ncbi:GNAT family N-acetyltransferase [Aurantimonas sp. VKM B-3413]|uniref:GNAT family N-acetyltransferase n=1 Tax=Aurantimonas sp. VKM B-3413 TaxID=2779401 RepID=UPI001E5422D4|nr:GNAT family N-acetyltransferase [Aurantimonas sp. VKM B-3413]MCB8837213.1 GNAT family N-acetyltransferase [Aurantimonas sp. VKM B-3413]